VSFTPSVWPRARLGELVRHRKEFITIDDLASYRRPRVKLHAQGVVVRDEVPGALIKTKAQQVCRTGDFLVAEIDAKMGGFGLVPEALAGAIVSSHYFLFEIDETRLARRFLDWFIRTPPFLEQVSAQGTTNYAAIRPSEVLQYDIPLPPLPEQQRIVAKIDEAAGHLDHALRQQTAVLAEADELCRALLRDPAAPNVPLRELVSLRPPDVSVQADETYHFAGVYSFGRGVFVGSEKAGTEFAYPRLTRLRTGNFVYPKLMAWEGAFGVVPPECDGLVVSTEFPVFEVGRERVLPDVLDVHFRNPSLWASIGGASTGTNVRRRRLNPQDFLNLEVPLPSMSRQHVLAQTCQHVREVKARQAESRAMLHALLPAILDRAFAGAL
jgi:type I restriction enzyme S subunit